MSSFAQINTNHPPSADKNTTTLCNDENVGSRGNSRSTTPCPDLSGGRSEMDISLTPTGPVLSTPEANVTTAAAPPAASSLLAARNQRIGLGASGAIPPSNLNVTRSDEEGGDDDSADFEDDGEQQGQEGEEEGDEEVRLMVWRKFYGDSLSLVANTHARWLQTETPEERALREQRESEALARQLMAEEAMLSYQQSTAFLQENASQFSGADLAALQAAMREEVSRADRHPAMMCPLVDSATFSDGTSPTLPSI